MSYNSNVEREANCPTKHRNRYVQCGDCRQIFPLSKAELDYATGRDEGKKEAAVGILFHVKMFLENSSGISSELSEGILNQIRSISFEQEYYKSDFGDDNRTQDINQTPERKKDNKDNREKYTK